MAGTGHETARVEPSALDLYLGEIQRIAVLTRQQELDLAVRVQQGDRAALEELVRHNLRFVVMVARSYARPGAPLEDLISEGNIGLMRAAQRFDVTRGYRFISYAVWWIRQCILLYLSDKSRTVRLPVNKVQTLSKLAHAQAHLEQVLGREPTPDELGRALRLPAAQVEWLQGLPTRTDSIDEREDLEECELEDTLQDRRGATIEESLTEALRDRDISLSLQALDPRSADILRCYFGLEGRAPESLSCIGRRYRLTGERIRQLRDRALWTLRNSDDADLLVEYAE
jgi:RNA polymerase primary sigma factor